MIPERIQMALERVRQAERLRDAASGLISSLPKPVEFSKRDRVTPEEKTEARLKELITVH